MDIKERLNVLNKNQQSALLKLINKKVSKRPDRGGLSFPCFQTAANLHEYKEANPLIKKLKKYISKNFVVTKCWAVYTEGDEITWHQHDEDLSIVYYLRNKESLGTLFRGKDKKVISLKAPENSLIIFRGKEIHSPPPKKRGGLKMRRYTVALNLSLY